MKEVKALDKIRIPEGVSVEVKDKVVKVSGPKGEITRDFSHAKKVRISVKGNEVIVEGYFLRKKEVAVVYSVAAHIRNMITGVTKGYRYWLKIIYSHFPITVKVEDGKVLIINFLGEKSPRVAKIVGDAKVKVQRSDIVVEGINIEDVGQTAANIEQATKITGFDRRVFVDGIYIYKKEYIEG